MDEINNLDCESLPIYTEIVLVLSQSVCFVVFFNFMQKFIIDRPGLMRDTEVAKKNIVQLLAIYFAIYIILFICMSPLYHYNYSVIVVSIVIIVTGSLLFQRVYKLADVKSMPLPKAFKSDNIF